MRWESSLCILLISTKWGLKHSCPLTQFGNFNTNPILQVVLGTPPFSNVSLNISIISISLLSPVLLSLRKHIFRAETSSPRAEHFAPGNSPCPVHRLVFTRVPSGCSHLCISVRSPGILILRHVAPVTPPGLEYLRPMILPSRCNFLLSLTDLLIKNCSHQII